MMNICRKLKNRYEVRAEELNRKRLEADKKMDERLAKLDISLKNIRSKMNILIDELRTIKLS